MTLYEKVGRRYRPVRQTMDYDAYPQGDYMVRVRPGSTNITTVLEPDYAGVLLAVRQHKDALGAAVEKASAIHPGQLKGRELKAWEAYKAIAGEQAVLFLHMPSIWDIVAALEDAVVAAAKGGK
jgi:hypothetical protein